MDNYPGKWYSYTIYFKITNEMLNVTDLSPSEVCIQFFYIHIYKISVKDLNNDSTGSFLFYVEVFSTRHKMRIMEKFKS